MKVKVLVSVAGVGFSYSPGEVVEDMPKERAEEFIRIGYAEEVKAARRATAKKK